MKVYHLEGCIIEKKTALIAVSLPKPENGNAYFIYKIHKLRKNQILIHFKDFFNADLQDSNNLEAFFLDLTTTEFSGFDFSKKIYVTLIHENSDVLPTLNAKIFDSAKAVSSIDPERVGTGLVRP